MSKKGKKARPRKPEGFGKGVQALRTTMETNVLPQLLDAAWIKQAWLKFSDDVSMPDSLDGAALEMFVEGAFSAGYVTAVGHIGRIIGPVETATPA